MAREAQAAIKQIPDLRIDARSYKATWAERGVVAHAYLEPVNDDSRRGYQLDFATSRESGPGDLGSRQAEIGSELVRELKALLLTEMQAAGWSISGHREGKEVWKRYEIATPAPIKAQPATPSTPEEKTPPAARPRPAQKQTLEQAHSQVDDQATPYQQRTIVRSTRAITFTCQWCHQEVTEQRFPSHKPLYCSNPVCKKEATRAKTRERVAAWYKAHPGARRKKG